MLLHDQLNLPTGMSELEVGRALSAMAAKNKAYATILRGAGAYDHYIPSIVKYIPAKEEFLTAYTPYQAEMSQGLLQSIFEYQTMICELTGMDVSNASVYDGATAAAEAAAMCRDRKRQVTLISATAHPDVINTVRTYCYGTGDELQVVPVKDGRTDVDALQETAHRRCGQLLRPAAQLLRSVGGRRSPGRARPRGGRQVHHGLSTPSPWPS